LFSKKNKSQINEENIFLNDSDIKDTLIKKLNSEINIFKIKKMKERFVLLSVVLLFIFELLFMFAFYVKFTTGKSLNQIINKPKNYVAEININKPITIDYVHNIENKMISLLKDKSCKEFLLRFNTPGGSPSASSDFGNFLKWINAKKRVNVYVESMAASGGYYIISYIKPIVANENAIVGSIGVIMPHYVIGKLANKIGVEEDDIAVGKYKKPISWFKKVSKKDKKYLLNNLLLPTYENFLKTVSKNRDIPLKELKTKYAEGKIFLAPKVKGILVDKIMPLIQFKENIKKRLRMKNMNFVKIYVFPRKSSFFNIKLDIDPHKIKNFIPKIN